MTTINVRIEKNVKEEANELLKELGLDMSTAVNLYLRQVIRHGGIPFEIKKANEATMAAIEEVKKIRAGEIKAKRYNDVDELFADLETK